MLFLLLQILPRSFFQSTYAYVYRHAKNTWGQLQLVPLEQACRSNRAEQASIWFVAISASAANDAYQFSQKHEVLWPGAISWRTRSRDKAIRYTPLRARVASRT